MGWSISRTLPEAWKAGLSSMGCQRQTRPWRSARASMQVLAK